MTGGRKGKDFRAPDADPLTLLCHDLRTPLNAIIGFAEMLDAEMLGSVGDQRYRDYARHIRESGAQLRDIISEMLGVLSEQGGARSLQVEPVDPGSLVDACLGLVRPEARAAGVRLAGRTAESRVRLMADRHAVVKILAALVQDAIASAQRGDRITLSCGVSAGPHGLVYSVDRPAPRKTRAPKPAASGHADLIAAPRPKRPDPGPAIWHWLVRLNGGRLDLERQPGAGWTARIGFPKALLRHTRQPRAGGPALT